MVDYFSRLMWVYLPKYNCHFFTGIEKFKLMDEVEKYEKIKISKELKLFVINT